MVSLIHRFHLRNTLIVESYKASLTLLCRVTFLWLCNKKLTQPTSILENNRPAKPECIAPVAEPIAQFSFLIKRPASY